jgi:hypothetical protein
MLHAVADHCDLAALLLEPATVAVLRWQDLRDDLVDARSAATRWAVAGWRRTA